MPEPDTARDGLRANFLARIERSIGDKDGRIAQMFDWAVDEVEDNARAAALATTTDFADIEARHHADEAFTDLDGSKQPASWCAADNQSLPCDAMRLLSALAAATLETGEDHPYETRGPDNVCIHCGQIGSYAHTYRAATAEPPRLLTAVEAAIENIQHNRVGAAIAGLRVARDLSRATPEPPDLSALRRLSEAATPGPWWGDGPPGGFGTVFVDAPTHDERAWLFDVREATAADGAFVAAAVNYVRSLLAQQPETGEPR